MTSVYAHLNTRTGREILSRLCRDGGGEAKACSPTILDKINGKPRPPLPPKSRMGKWRVFALRAASSLIWRRWGFAVPFYFVQDCRSSIMPKIMFEKKSSIMLDRFVGYIWFPLTAYTCRQKQYPHKPEEQCRIASITNLQEINDK